MIATDRQQSFIASLTIKKMGKDPDPAYIAKITKAEASRLIERLLEQPDLEVKERVPAVSKITAGAGFYILDGEVTRVTTSKTSGRLYAQSLDSATGRWAYDRGRIYRLTPEMKITVAQAAEYGHLHGRCAICGRTLTTTKSVTAGIGPVCMKTIGETA